MPKRSISEIIKDSISARNQELDRLYSNKPSNVRVNKNKFNTSGKIKSSIPTGTQYQEENPEKLPTKVQFTRKHQGKWAVFTQENLGGGNVQWRVHSVHDTIDDTIPHLDNGVDLNVPMYVDKNLHPVNMVGHEKFL